MSERDLSFLSVMAPPQDAPRSAIAMCQSDADALLTSIASRKERSKSWFAAKLGISRSYFTEISKGQKAIPEWMIVPFCVLTGTNLLQQYRDFQKALRVVSDTESESARIERIARELTKGASK